MKIKKSEYKGMKVVFVDYKGCYEESQELDNYELDHFVNLGATEVYYWYAIGSYEGGGAVIYKVGNLWYDGSLSHCSCYGPIESLGGFDPNEGKTTPQGLVEKYDPDNLDEDIKVVLNAITGA